MQTRSNFYIVCCLLSFLGFNCNKHSNLFFESSIGAINAGYQIRELSILIANSENPCQLKYPFTYVDSINGQATYWGIKTTLSAIASDTFLLKNGYYLFTNSYNCALDSIKCQSKKSWGKYFNIMLLSIDELGFLKNGQKQGKWITHTLCEDTLKGYYSNNPDKYLTDSLLSVLAHGDLFFREQIYPYFRVEFYQEGLRHGKYLFYDLYFRNIIYATTFKNGTGYYKDFYLCEGMPIQSEGQYIKGQKVGKWLYYTPLGKQTIVKYPK